MTEQELINQMSREGIPDPRVQALEELSQIRHLLVEALSRLGHLRATLRSEYDELVLDDPKDDGESPAMTPRNYYKEIDWRGTPLCVVFSRSLTIACEHFGLATLGGLADALRSTPVTECSWMSPEQRLEAHYALWNWRAVKHWKSFEGFPIELCGFLRGPVLPTTTKGAAR